VDSGRWFQQGARWSLLNNLLTDEAWYDTQLRFPDFARQHNDYAKAVRNVRAEGAAAKYWEDAEQFLEFLDAAARAPDSVTGRKISALVKRLTVPVDVKAFAGAARRMIIAWASCDLASPTSVTAKATTSAGRSARMREQPTRRTEARLLRPPAYCASLLTIEVRDLGEDRFDVDEREGGTRAAWSRED
jgi:hypothetical protein